MARKIDVRQATIDGITRRIGDLNEQSLTQLSQYISYLKWQEEMWHSLLDDETAADPDQVLLWQYDFVEAFPAARKVATRTPEMLESLKKDVAELADPHSERTAIPIPPYAKNDWRSIKPEYLVLIGICTHLGCSPVEKFTPGAQPSLPDNWPGGFFCPCHGSTFDFAGRVFKNKPAPDNLEVPRYTYLSDSKLLIGDDKKA